jgi:hypothetical protein
MNRLEAAEFVIDHPPVEIGSGLQRQSRRPQQEHRRQDPFGDREHCVPLIEPSGRRRKVDVGADVVVRDLALGTGHRTADGTAHGGGLVLGRLRYRGGRSADYVPHRPDVVGHHQPVGSRRRHRRQLDPQLGGDAPSHRRCPPAMVIGCSANVLPGDRSGRTGRHHRRQVDTQLVGEMANRGPSGRPTGRRRLAMRRRLGGRAGPGRRFSGCWNGWRCFRGSSDPVWFGGGDDGRQRGAHRQPVGPRLNQQLCDNPVLPALHLDDALVGLDLGDHLTPCDCVTG